MSEIEAKRKIAETLLEMERRRNSRKIYTFYPGTGPLRRELYSPHLEFFKAGAKARERAIIAANGIGKTEGVGGYEVTLHLTGLYPDWWEGRRFKKPIHAWAAGDTGQTTKEIIQAKLLGPAHAIGTGLIPGELITDTKRKSGNVADAIEQVLVRHVSGGNSILTFKSYEQGRKGFQGTEREVIWLDEECPEDVYEECLYRTRKVNGMILVTFTPIMGLTPVVLGFMPNGLIPNKGWITKSKFTVNATWEHAPHLTEKEKQEILSGTMPHLRDARTKGIPSMGAGSVYPLENEEVVSISDFEIPPYFLRAYSLDVGWNCTAALWGAIDRETDVIYLYSCHKAGHIEPATHVQSINARGVWIPGVVDPASVGSGQMDGKRLIDEYIGLGLNLSYANNAVEAGIFSVWQRMISGRLKVFKSLLPWFNELRTYRRESKPPNNVARDQDDHLMDCTRYMVLSGVNVATIGPYDEEENYFNRHRDSARKYEREGYFGYY